MTILTWDKKSGFEVKTWLYPFDHVVKMRWKHHYEQNNLLLAVILPTPKNNGQTNTAVVGLKHCKRIGSMQDLKVNSSDSGATMWALSHIRSCKLFSQKDDSGNRLKYYGISGMFCECYLWKVLENLCRFSWLEGPEKGSLWGTRVWKLLGVFLPTWSPSAQTEKSKNVSGVR